ncbi:universal stress protein [Pseudonocardia sp. CA-107938]|uniref:universal stress protein n=1 Tax=Pseudonocardia sp. CA-107938 TaxID=3240021 RepID=UPI003D8C51D3
MTTVTRSRADEIEAQSRRAGRPVLVGDDGSAAALNAVRWAAREAQRRDRPLRILHVDGAANAMEGRLHALARRGERILERATVVAEDVVAGVPQDQRVEIRTSVVLDRPAGRLVADAAGADLVVLGREAMGRADRVGSVIGAVLADAACLVAVVPAGTSVGDDGAVVVGVAPTTPQDVLDVAFAAAESRGVPLVAVHAWEESVHGIDPLLEQYVAVMVDAHRTWLAGWAARYPAVPMRSVVRRGHPSAVLLDVATTAGLVVVGPSRRRWSGGPAVGSVARTLLREAPCPLVVVPRRRAA